MIINIADMKKIKCNELIKLFINKVLLLIDVYEPTKILCTWYNGMNWTKIKKTIPILKELPDMTSMVLIPAATPLLNGGTELMIDALLGDANIPIPAPTSNKDNIPLYKDIFGPIVVRIKKPIADISRPVGIISRKLYLS